MKPAVASFSARDLRLHLSADHSRDSRGFSWLELVNAHDRQHTLGADHEHEQVEMPSES